MPSDVAPSIALLALAAIHESPTNPRKHFAEGPLAELTASIREQGVLSPILVRPAPGGAPGYEIVYGHRRARAAAAAGLTHVPAIVKAMGDREALETQLQENAQRVDVHPLEEAEGYKRLLDEFGGEVEEIAGKVGKSTSYIYKRLKLLALNGAAREAFLDGKLDASRALLVARIPDAELQADAVRRMRLGRDDTFSMSLAEAAKMVERDFMLRLAEAPFPTKACAKCPKRTGSQAALFEDVSSPDLCTDASCYRRKADEAWEAKKATAEKRGRKVLSEEEANALFPWGDRLGYGTGYIDLGDAAACNYDVDRRPWTELLKTLPVYKRGERTLLARTGDGRVHELVVEADALDALRDAGVVPTPDDKPREDTTAPAEPRRPLEEERRESELTERANRLAIGECAARAEAGQGGETIWALLVRVLTTPVCDTRGSDTAERRGICGDGGPAVALRALVDRSPASVARGIALEIALDDALDCLRNGEQRELLADVCRVLGVDLERLERVVRADSEEERAAAEKPEKKASGKGSKKKPAAEAEEVADA